MVASLPLEGAALSGRLQVDAARLAMAHALRLVCSVYLSDLCALLLDRGIHEKKGESKRSIPEAKGKWCVERIFQGRRNHSENPPIR